MIPRERGTVLMVTLWVILVLAGLALAFARSMRVEALSAAHGASRVQAGAVARAAVAYCLSALRESGGDPGALETVPWEAVAVGEGRFWVLRPDPEQDRSHAFGLQDESARLNLNAASLESLAALPGSTPAFAAAVLDWRDADDEVTPGGAESEAYLLRVGAHLCKNAPLETVDEGLQLEGASPELLRGEDANRNGVLDPREDDGDAQSPPDDRDGRLERGLAPYLTVHSRERNQDAQGQPRVYINDPDTRPLAELFRPVVEASRFFPVMDRVRGGRPYANVLDFYLRTGLTREEFAAVEPRLTETRAPELVGRVNVYTAPRAVLRALPGLEDPDVEALLAWRADPATDRGGIAWVAEALAPAKAAAVGGLLTHRGRQFGADVVALAGDGRAFRRLQVVVDTLEEPPRVVYQRDLTALGWPLPHEWMAPTTESARGSP